MQAQPQKMYFHLLPQRILTKCKLFLGSRVLLIIVRHHTFLQSAMKTPFQCPVTRGSKSVLSYTAITSHMCLLSTCRSQFLNPVILISLKFKQFLNFLLRGLTYLLGNVYTVWCYGKLSFKKLHFLLLGYVYLPAHSSYKV